MYILQLLAFENEISKMHNEKQNVYQGIVSVKDKIIFEKEEEIKILKEKLNTKYEKYEKHEKIGLFETQFKKINEFISSNVNRNSNSPTKRMKAYHNLLDETTRYKVIINDVLEKFKNNKQEEIQIYLEKISNELPNLALYPYI